MDDPEMIVNEAIAKHQAMIKSFSGAPGVLPERLADAFTVRHCALSLVGEPIFYPRINELVRLLHARRISTFLVTNAQFPESLATLEPVTQLYVSIDAATKETLKAIDRPLFADFWERFLACLDALRAKQQRTVFRLTLIKGQNMEEEHLGPYIELIKRGMPEFIEVKGFTYCGKSDTSDLRMENVPWHAEVRAYCERLAELTGGEYEPASEHEHSCLVFLARKKFKVNGHWHTHIDFARFNELVARYYETGGKETFTSLDYSIRTPDWAVYGSKERGFDPADTRWRRTKDGGGVTATAYKPSESGCG
jgi:tRNA wybutosine-synthesizing protein 1